MPPPVSLVTVHHEGAGDPCSMTQAFRMASGGYTYAIADNGWVHFRDAWSSYATLNYNHVSLDLVLSGNRMNWLVSDADIQRLGSAVTDARQRGYVVDRPQVRAHRNSPGSSTVCPGDHTMARWNDVVAACLGTGAPVPPPASHPVWPGVYLENFTDDHGTVTWQARMAERGWTIVADDKYGPASESVCRAFQSEKGLAVDGIVGPVTWDAAWTLPVT